VQHTPPPAGLRETVKIGTRFTIAMVFFGVTLVAIAVSLFVTSREVRRVREQQAHAFTLELEAWELGALTNDFLLNRDRRLRARWDAKFTALSAALSALTPEGTEQQAIVDAIRENHRQLRAQFTQVASALGNTASIQSSAAVMAYIRAAWKQLEAHNREAAIRAERLAMVLEARVDRLRRRNATLSFILVGASCAFLLANYTLVQRRLLQAMADLEREIPERRRAETNLVSLSADLAARNVELETVNKDLESFVYSVSHDLRQPLRAMHSFSQLLEKEYAHCLDDRGRDYLARVHRGTARMSQLIRDLLALARVARQEIERETVDVSAAATAAVGELQEAHPDRRVEAVVQPGLVASADPRLLEVALANLLGNAWKFTAKREQARIEFGAAERDGKTVFSVRDNGIGFDPKLAGKAFQPFQRLHSDNEVDGTGIGLTIVERVVRRHVGSIWIDGAADEGATVSFTLG